MPGTDAPPAPAPPLGALWRVFGRIGLLSFGGPAAQIALLHAELVARRRWLDEEGFLRALSFCMLLPGPEAMQLATYAGWRLRGTAGGLIAGLLFVLPGAAVVLALAAVYAAWGQVPAVAAVFAGVQAAVLAIVVQALVRLARRALLRPWHRVLAVAALVALFAFGLPFPVVILAAAAAGWAMAPPPPPAPPAAPVAAAAVLRPAALWASVWLVPLAALIWFEGAILAAIGIFFSQLAVLTFGGAYAVLAWMTQTVVHDFGWLTTAEMVAGLGLAETTPGPLILVTEFVGYLAAYRQGGAGLGVAGAAVALWMTFAPCFLWIFAGAPLVERLGRAPRLSSALAGISAAVVGVIASLSLWFALHVLFAEVVAGPLALSLPVPSSLRPQALAVAVLAGAALLWRGWPMPAVLAGAGAMSWALAAL